jgi:SAM-dependent methyltransferase
MAEYARTHLNLEVATGTLEEFQSERQYDLVSMIQVVAHFVDPQRALQVAASKTREGGFWLVETWNRESWTARALGKHWHEYSPPSVLHWFSTEGLRRLAAQFGFHEVARGRPSKWIGGEHAKSLLRYRLEGSRLGRVLAGGVSLIPDRLALPYPAEDLFWTLYQKS